jgi:hypothetical protein
MRFGVASGMHYSMPVEKTSRKSGVRSEAIPAPGQTPGSLYSFLPADGASRAGAVSRELSRTLTEGLGVAVLLADFACDGYSLWPVADAPRRLDGRTWGAFVSQRDGVDILDAREVHPRQLASVIDYARARYHVICADLTGAKSAHAMEIFRASDGIFLVGSTDASSLEGVHEKLEWLRAINLDDNCGLLLEQLPNRVTPTQVEERTGLPVCGLINNSQQIDQLANWLAASSERSAAYAMAG